MEMQSKRSNRASSHRWTVPAVRKLSDILHSLIRLFCEAIRKRRAIRAILSSLAQRLTLYNPRS